MQSQDTVLIYDNYVDKKQTIPIAINVYLLDVIDLTPDTKISIDTSISLGISIPNEDVLFDFFCEQDIINGRLLMESDPDSVYTRDAGFVKFNTDENAIIEESKKLISNITLIGRLDIHNELNSLLVQVNRSSGHDSIKDLYLVNYRNRTILSIARISYYFQGEIVFNGYTLVNKRRVFSLHDVIIEPIEPSGKKNYKEKESVSKPLKVDYIINTQGKVELR